MSVTDNKTGHAGKVNFKCSNFSSADNASHNASLLPQCFHLSQTEHLSVPTIKFYQSILTFNCPKIIFVIFLIRIIEMIVVLSPLLQD